MANTYLKVIKEAENKSNDREEQIKQARLIWSQGFIAQEIEDFCIKHDGVKAILPK